jgi:hypothetical protein
MAADEFLEFLAPREFDVQEPAKAQHHHEAMDLGPVLKGIPKLTPVDLSALAGTEFKSEKGLPRSALLCVLRLYPQSKNRITTREAIRSNALQDRSSGDVRISVEKLKHLLLVWV